jgi:hypothetical protein
MLKSGSQVRLCYGREPNLNDLKRLVAGFPPRRAGFDLGSGQVGFVVDKVALGMFSPSTSVSLASLHYTNCFTITLHHLVLVE